MLQKQIEAKLATYHDPYLNKDLLSANVVKSIQVTQAEITLNIVLGYPCRTVEQEMRNQLQILLKPLVEPAPLTINISSRIEAHAGKLGVSGMTNVKNVIAVASGKGGVGKSTVSLNLAVALMQAGARVGMLDADIYGPSQPTMLGAVEEKAAVKDKKLQPILRNGIQSMSIGYLVSGSAPLAWRGPMLGKALQQLTYDTEWDDVDYLIIDLPPGTGDVQLTLCQKMPVTGAVIVTTPQDVALVDVRRACEMFQKMNVPMLGIVENMSGHQCKHCGQTDDIFGSGGALQLSKEYQLPVLATIPLDADIRTLTDSGQAVKMTEMKPAVSSQFKALALKIAGNIALQAKDYATKFPKIVIEK